MRPDNWKSMNSLCKREYFYRESVLTQIQDLQDKVNSLTSGGTLCVFGSHTLVSRSWMCKKQTSVSHSSTESDIISLDARLRMHGTPALDLWNLIVTVLHGNTHQNDQVREDQCTNLFRAAPHKLSTRKKSHGMIDELNIVNFYSLWRTFFSQGSFVVNK